MENAVCINGKKRDEEIHVDMEMMECEYLLLGLNELSLFSVTILPSLFDSDTSFIFPT